MFSTRRSWWAYLGAGGSVGNSRKGAPSFRRVLVGAPPPPRHRASFTTPVFRWAMRAVPIPRFGWADWRGGRPKSPPRERSEGGGGDHAKGGGGGGRAAHRRCSE